MNYKTHFNFGILCSSLFIMYIYKGGVNLIPFILTASVMALIPDYDHNKSYITQRISPIICILIIGYIIYKYHIYILIASLIWFILAKVTKHRTFTHSLIGMLVFVIPFMFSPYAIPVLIGYASHLFADLLTIRGCPLFYPFFKEKINLLRITTNSKTEHFITFLLIIGNMLLIIQYILPRLIK